MKFKSTMKKITFLLLCLCFKHFTAQTNSQNSADILQALKKLNCTGSALYIAAHPDDENTRLLAYLAKEKNLRTAYLSLTRGDGGQNLIGKEQGEALGLIRTQELLAARRTDGAEQFFTRANDFGYSKNPEETFGIWNKDSILSDVVFTIRKFKPDVIICRFPTTGEGGHGHHTASAMLAQEAIDAAADSTRFPEQLKYTTVWKARRLFWNTFNFGGTNTTAPNQLKIDVGVYNVLLGKSYGEIAAESRSMHKSQGFGSAKLRGEAIEYFKLIKGDSARKELCEGQDQTWNRFAETKPLAKRISQIIAQFNTQQPEKSISDLIWVYKQLLALNSNNDLLITYKKQKLKECENILLACCGLWAEANSADYSTVPGSVLSMSAQIIARNQCDVKLNSITFLNQVDTSVQIKLNANTLYNFKHHDIIAQNTPYSNPYWLNEKHSIGMYAVKQKYMIGLPENESQNKITFNINIQDLNLKIERPLVYKSTDPIKGEVYRNLEILPPVTILLSEKVFVFNDNKTKSFNIIVKANKANVTGQLRGEIKSNESWPIQIKNADFTIANKGDEVSVEVLVTGSEKNTDGILKTIVKVDGIDYSKSIKRIEYDHIPYQFILSDAEAKLLKLDVKMANTNIGYIPGAGDDVPSCLTQIGYSVTVLNDEMLSKEDLSKYQAIVTGVRAYNTNERLQIHYNKLMNYIQNGGNLIVQYNTNNRIGPVGTKVGPYPFTISRDRVTDDNAEVRFINPKHPVLHFPNEITSQDFNDWVQERGIYFASDIDKNYETIFSMNDPKEKASEGSLIIGKYGKGNFVYSGLVFFRQLPAGIPGAYRLFSNLIALPKNQ